MRPTIILAALAAVCYSAVAIAEPEYQWTRVVEVDAVEIEVLEVTIKELRSVERRHGHARPAQERIKPGTRLVGLSVLYRKGTEFRCEVYVLDKADEATIAHERRHCYGWAHE